MGWLPKRLFHHNPSRFLKGGSWELTDGQSQTIPSRSIWAIENNQVLGSYTTKTTKIVGDYDLTHSS